MHSRETMTGSIQPMSHLQPKVKVRRLPPRPMFLEVLLFYSHRTDYAKGQAWDLIVRVKKFR